MKNHDLLISPDTIYKGVAKTVEQYYMVAEYTSEIDEFADGRSFVYPSRSISHPYIVPNTIHIGGKYNTSVIIGELYDVPDYIIKQLDIHEGCPTKYNREIVDIVFDCINIVANAYILRNESIIATIHSCNTLYEPINTGDWLSIAPPHI